MTLQEQSPAAHARNDVLLAAGAFLIAFALWQFPAFSPVVYPLRLLVTFIHELGHGTAALLTGGKFLNFEVSSNGAGLAYSSGGIRPIVISAGYVGTAIFGAVLLLVANRVKQPRHVAIGLGSVFIALTLFYSGLGLSNINVLEGLLTLALLAASGYFFTQAKTNRDRLLALGGFVFGGMLLINFAAGDNRLTVVVGVISGIVLVLIGYYASRDVALFTLNFLAFMVGLNAITDAWVLLQIVSRPELVLRNDAVSMANATPLPAIFWAVMWIGLAILLLGGASWLALVRPLRIKDKTPG